MAPKVPVAPRPDQCPIGRRCHPSGKLLTTFGTKFTRGEIRLLASSSVLIGGPNVFKNDVFTLIGSGTLVHDNVVLCAGHSIQTLSDKDIRFFFFFECDAATAPAGSADQYKAETDFLNCTKVRGPAEASAAQARGVKVIERGDLGALDYALVAIEWTAFTARDSVTGAKIVQVPRAAIKADIASPRLTDELVLIAHPGEQPTQASVGKLLRSDGPHPTTNSGTDYGYASFFAVSGSSGGGVFNTDSQIVGILNGAKVGEPGNAFLKLSGIAAQKPQSRIAQWVNKTNVAPVFPGDPTDPVQFLVVP